MEKINNKVSCFFCSTPFQVLGAINITKQYNLTSDIYISNWFSQSYDLYKKLKSMNIFNNVYFFNEEKIMHYKSRFLTRHPSIYNIFLNIIMKKVKYKTIYEQVFLIDNHYLHKLIYNYTKKTKPNCIFFRYDDGIGTYCKESSHEIAENLDTFVYNPDFYKKVFNKKAYKINFQDDNENLFKEIFNFNSTINEKFLIFGICNKQLVGNNGAEKLENIYKNINNIVNNNLVIKQHPREKEKIKNINLYENTLIPFEIINKYQDFSNKIFITVMSTAAFSPKIFFDQEPKIILLIKIMKEHYMPWINLDDIIDYYKSLYNDSSKIIIPETEEDLYNILKNINEEKL